MKYIENNQCILNFTVAGTAYVGMVMKKLTSDNVGPVWYCNDFQVPS